MPRITGTKISNKNTRFLKSIKLKTKDDDCSSKLKVQNLVLRSLCLGLRIQKKEGVCVDSF